MNASQKIASRAMAIDPLPKPLQTEYAFKYKTVTRIDRSVIEARGRVDFDGDYDLTIGLQGEHPAGKPVQMEIRVDGKVVQVMSVETKPSGLVYFNPCSPKSVARAPVCA